MPAAIQTQWSHNDYSVGWVCALPNEQTAAMAMLDERHKDLPKQPNDPNNYILGSMGEHNIVIACLPAGQIGTNSAATAATSMVSTFPRIRFGLMVGIGGSVSAKVRLGDVVISQPGDGFPGVVQWDIGKATSGGFQRTGALNNPPITLLTAVTKLMSFHAMAGSKVPEYFDTVRTKWPRLEKYLNSKSLEDVRFRADYQHIGESTFGDEDDEEDDDAKIGCRLCDRTMAVLRKARNEDDVKVHYGLIASGNQVIKDAHVRDRLNRELGGKVLCVEMEAAGLMNNFPCIVIRGICDYSDSHKNKAWQKYAAAVAAAVAKELLQYVTPYDVEKERTIKDTIGHVLEKVIEVEQNVGQIKSSIDKEYDQKVLNWLSPFDHSLQQNDHLRKHQAGTGNWFLESAKYKTWVDTHKQTLFCPGMPGAGKTVLTAVVIDNLVSRFSNEQSVGVAYLYFNFWRQDDSRVEGLIANLLKQLVHRPPSPQACKHVRDLYDRHYKNRTWPSLHEITRCLELVIKEFSRVFIIADALDECATDNQCRARFIAELLKFSSYGANVFATSRSIPEVTEKFDKWLRLEIRASDEDVRAYVAVQIAQSESGILKAKREKAVTKIADAADGMFLLAKLDIESLLDERLPRQVEEALMNLPRGSNAYEQAYEKAIKRVCGEPNSDPKSRSARLAREVLLWTACSKRRLGPAELQHALAVKPRDSGLDLENIPHEKDLVSVCAGLVIIDKTSNVVCLFHRTAQEYLEGARAQWFPNADNEITKVSVTYLAFDVFKSGRCSTGFDLERRLEMYRLYDYAARYWGHHARDVHKLDPLVTSFLQELSKVEASSQILLGLSTTRTTGLHLAAYFGVDEAIRALLGQYDCDSRDGYYRTPLSWAAQNGHEAAVRSLLAEGADPASKDSLGLTPLMHAKQGKHEAIVRLLENGLNGERSVPDKSNLPPTTVEAPKSGHLEEEQRMTKQTHNPPNPSPATEATKSGSLEGGQKNPTGGMHNTSTTDACINRFGITTRLPLHGANLGCTSWLEDAVRMDSTATECFQGFGRQSQVHSGDDCLRNISSLSRTSPAPRSQDCHYIDGHIDGYIGVMKKAIHPCIAETGFITTTTKRANQCLQSLPQTSCERDGAECLEAFFKDWKSAAHPKSPNSDCLAYFTKESGQAVVRDCTLWI